MQVFCWRCVLDNLIHLSQQIIKSLVLGTLVQRIYCCVQIDVFSVPSILTSIID